MLNIYEVPFLKIKWFLVNQVLVVIKPFQFVFLITGMLAWDFGFKNNTLCYPSN